MKMNEIEKISVKELRILLAHDKNEPIEKTATSLGMTEPEVREILAIALKKREKLVSEAGAGGVPFVYYRPIDETVGVPQRGTMKVGSQILKQLSEGIYTSPAGSLKELISNSYDSDAEEVTINITEDELTVRDNGSGMDWQDFDREFTFISYSAKRLESDRSKIYGRPIIGFIGIGFLAVSELCDILEIKSCKKNSELFFKAIIDFSKYRKPEVAEKEFYEISEYELTNCKKKDENIALDESFTEIKLKNLRQGFKRIISDKEPFNGRRVSIEDVWQYVYDRGTGITGLGEYWQMILNLALICPVVYSDDGPVRAISDKTVTEIKSTLKSFNFRVVVDGIELVKPMVFPNSSSIAKSKEYAIHPIRESIKTSEGTLSFKGYIYSQHRIIDPKECMGILIRIKNVAVGGYDRTFLGYPSGSYQLFRNWISSEIYVEEGLEGAMNVNRSSFKITNPDYIALRDWLHRFLNEEVFPYTDKHYYVRGRESRQAEKEAESMRVFEKIVKSEMGSKFKFKYGALPREESVLINKDEETVVMNTEYPVFRRMPARFENILQRIMVLFEIALEKSKGDVQKLERIFKEEIEKWINE
jgi:hypothetical protein